MTNGWIQKRISGKSPGSRLCSLKVPEGHSAAFGHLKGCGGDSWLGLSLGQRREPSVLRGTWTSFVVCDPQGAGTGRAGPPLSTFTTESGPARVPRAPLPPSQLRLP